MESIAIYPKSLDKNAFYLTVLLCLFWPLTLLISLVKLVRICYKNIGYLKCTPEVIKKFLKWGFFE